MVRGSNFLKPSSFRSLHVRGDGPAAQSVHPGGNPFSPRAWGWSGHRGRSVHSAWVLPTCVGMVREYVQVVTGAARSPHVRGDGPTSRASRWLPRNVLPTCVGMVRIAPYSVVSSCCSPHVRGDGPVRTSSRAPACGSPHVRGDGPFGPNRDGGDCSFSPRAWGWSVHDQALESRLKVLPTCVGMVRPEALMPWRTWSSPHVRGDGPNSCLYRSRDLEFSPRAWGWSDHHARAKPGRNVLPTCVGMVRDVLGASRD